MTVSGIAASIDFLSARCDDCKWHIGDAKSSGALGALMGGTSKTVVAPGRYVNDEAAEAAVGITIGSLRGSSAGYIATSVL